MSKNSNQKLKILYLMKIFMEKTDENHGITMGEIVSLLGEYGVSAERKSIYGDIENLKVYGLDIVGEQVDRQYFYRLVNRQFELAELKLLVDSVQAAKFITVKKSNELIRKIEEFASVYEARQLQRQVYVAKRVKTMNENIYYNVDRIHGAINENRKIKFQYFSWNVEKEMELKRNGDYYTVSPWALSWDDENYYLVAFEAAANKIKHFRVDKMLNLDIVQETREGRAVFQVFDMALYAKKMFGMFAGTECNVKLECENNMANVIIDRFGKETALVRTDDSHFTVNVNVSLSSQFIGWVIALGESVKILEPQEAVEKMRGEIQRLARQYEV